MRAPLEPVATHHVSHSLSDARVADCSLPKILLVARAHSISPGTILRRVLARRANDFKQGVARRLRLDALRLTPQAAAAVVHFKKTHGQPAPTNVPSAVLPIVTGSFADLAITGVFPRTQCFVQADLQTLALRWTHHSHFVALNTVLDVRAAAQMSSCKSVSGRDPVGSGEPKLRGLFATLSGRLLQTPVLVRFSDHGGCTSVLELKMPGEMGFKWITGLRMLMKQLPRTGQPCHWRWSLSCMAATSRRGATGYLNRSEIRSLLRRANANANLAAEVIEMGIQYAEKNDKRTGIPQWLMATTAGHRGHQQMLLNARKITGMLLTLSTASQAINNLFSSHSKDEQLCAADWSQFVRTEQLAVSNQQLDDEQSREQLSIATAEFEHAIESADAAVDRLQFALLLLGPQNDAVAPAADPAMSDSLREPFAHYWTACSHNSYIVGDQLTGRSTADIYRRHLLQACRQVEIDCWDGPAQKPIVTHGNTFCTVETFDRVAKGITDCAFVTSEMPVALSLEMHCTPRQQQDIAKTMVKHFGSALIAYDELASMKESGPLSPFALQRRILAKGKAKRVEKHSKKSFAHRLSARFTIRQPLGRESTAERPVSECSERGEFSLSRDSYLEIDEDLAMQASKSMEKRRTRSSRNGTDEYYKSLLSLRSVSVSAFLGQGSPEGWVLPITSMNESKFLALLGLSRNERSEIEGLRLSRPGVLHESDHGFMADQLSTRAVIQLAENPPAEVGDMQRRTALWLLRPYPLGLRFSGKNMSPQPCWLAGAQSVALNMSHNDFAMQLHFALFNGSRGYLIKPPEMRGIATTTVQNRQEDTSRDAYWPPPLETCHCVTIETFTLHNLPKRGEQRPRYEGRRGACHRYHPELSGPVSATGAPPNNLPESSPALSVALHPIGGFCAVSQTLPLPTTVATEITTTTVKGNGMNPAFDQKFHCVAAEPCATFLRIGVIVGGQEVSYAISILGRLRRGYRILQLRSPLGTRIELAYLFVKVSMSSHANLWSNARHLRLRSIITVDKADELAKEVEHLKKQLSEQQAT